jgi:peptide/nickel transport system ATP-binding protein
MKKPVLQIKGLKTHFFTFGGVVKAVDGINLSIGQEEVVGLVGESGCGKSVTFRSVLGLVRHPGKVVAGSILLEGEDLLTKSERQMQRIRGGRLAMIFQNPLTSLNPVFTVGEQLGRIISIHHGLDRKAARHRAMESLELVRMPDADLTLKKYPHQLSGGQLQRVMIAMALSCRPRLLIADEPTTALDVTIQAQILTLMLNLKKETNTSIALITHDLAVVAETCQRVAVMYAGLIVEQAPVDELFNNPLHPYTQGLLASLPGPGPMGQDLQTIEGLVPDLVNPPSGCRFHPRCGRAVEQCTQAQPEMMEQGRGHWAACHML